MYDECEVRGPAEALRRRKVTASSLQQKDRVLRQMLVEIIVIYFA